MADTVFCIATSEDQARRIVSELKTAGFADDEISVLFPDKEGTREFAAEQHTKAPEGAAAGATTGAVLGGVVGWLAGVGSLAIPGLGPFIAAGPILATLSGAAVGGAVGGITGALIGMGMPEHEAKLYEGKVKEGGILIAVVATEDEEQDRAEEIMQRAGAQDIMTGSAEREEEEEEEEVEAAPPRRASARRASRAPAAGATAAGATTTGFDYDESPELDESFQRYRADFESDYQRASRAGAGSFEEAAPAYRYGCSLALDRRYGAGEWSTVRNDARQRWEARNPGTWDRVEEAIRYGWERARGRRCAPPCHSRLPSPARTGRRRGAAGRPARDRPREGSRCRSA
jgi:hypothetical protein